MAKKRVRALNTDGDMTWCSAEVMGAKGCNHLAHGTEDEVETAQIEFFLNEGGLIGNAVTSKVLNSTIANDDKNQTARLKEKARLADAIKADGFTREHLNFLADASNDDVLLDADYKEWSSQDFAISKQFRLTEAQAIILYQHIKSTHSIVALRSLPLSSIKSPYILKDLLKQDSHTYDRSISTNPHTPGDVLTSIYRRYEDMDWARREIFKNLLKNPSTPTETLELIDQKLEEMELQDFLAYGAHNSNFPHHLQEKIKKLSGYGGTRERAESILTPLEDLEELAHDDDWNTRQNVATNPNTPVEVLERLSKDEQLLVRKAVAANSNIPVELLEVLAKNMDTRSGVLWNPQAPAHLLREIGESLDGNDTYSRNHWNKILLSNPNTPTDLLEKHAKSRSKDVMYTLGKHPNTSLATLKKFLKSKDPKVRLQALSNPRWTYEELYEMYKTDKSHSKEMILTKIYFKLLDGENYQDG